MERRVLWMAMLLVAALGVGCGGDDSGGDGDNESGSGGDDNEAGAGGGMVEGEGLPCGGVRCQMPSGSTAEPCCFDAFSDTCGMMGGFGGMACVSIIPVDERCPSIMAGPITLSSCCTPDNMCGITAGFISMDCTELSVAEQMFMDRFSGGDEDGGTGGPMFSLDFPPAQACE